jgi:osmotically-inducible protein OsmY
MRLSGDEPGPPVNGNDSADRVVEEVRGLLVQVGRLTCRRIEVSREDDRIVLRGTVRSWFEKQLAQHLAMQAVGIPVLVNAIVVDPARLHEA